MNFLIQLGINETYFYQLSIFLLALVILTQFVFKDFTGLLAKRSVKTVGSEGLAREALKKAADLTAAFETQARAINGDIKAIYDSYRDEANGEFEQIIAVARAESAKLVDENRHKITVQIAEASRQLKEEIPTLSKAMVTKLTSQQTSSKVL